MKELASRLDLTASALSQIESGRTSPSLARVHQLAHALGMSMTALVAEAPLATDFDTKQGSPLSVLYSDVVVQRCADAPVIRVEKGLSWTRISPGNIGQLDFLTVSFEPRSGYAEHLLHAGFEIVLVQTGKLEFKIGFETFNLAAGDSIMYPSSTPHRMLNVEAEPAQVLAVVVSDSLITK